MKFPKLLQKFNLIVGTICGILILFVALLTSMEGTLRSVFSKPTTWSMDICRYLFIWLVFLGSAYSFQVNGHVGVDFVRERIGSQYGLNVRKILSIFGYILSILFIVVLFQNSIKMINLAIKLDQLTTAMIQIPTVYLLIAIPIGSIFMLITLICIIADIISGGKKYL